MSSIEGGLNNFKFALERLRKTKLVQSGKASKSKQKFSNVKPQPEPGFSAFPSVKN